MLPPVLKHMQSLGHVVFTDGDYNLNLFGIRSSIATGGHYDDLIGCAYKADGQWIVRYWTATTDPGEYYLQTASEDFGVSGTAIMAPGQYRGAYELGRHGGTRYEALVQTGAPVGCYRDANRDLVLDEGPISTGWFGLNIHASSMHPYKEDTDNTDRAVWKWSGGCQVHATTEGFREMMDLCHKQVEMRGWDRFSYSLLKEW